MQAARGEGRVSGEGSGLSVIVDSSGSIRRKEWDFMS